MMVSKRNFLFQGLIFRFHIKLQGYIQTSYFQIYTRWPGEKRRSLRGIGSHEDDHAVEGGALRGAWDSQGMGIPKNSQGCQGSLQIIHRFGWLGGGLVYVLCSKVFGVTIVGEFFLSEGCVAMIRHQKGSFEHIWSSLFKWRITLVCVLEEE